MCNSYLRITKHSTRAASLLQRKTVMRNGEVQHCNIGRPVDEFTVRSGIVDVASFYIIWMHNSLNVKLVMLACV